MKRYVPLLVFWLLLSVLNAVSYQEYNPNDDRFRVLALEKAKIRMEQSEREWQNAKQLYEKKYISLTEYKEYELQYKNDKINYEQYMLSVIYDKPHISVISAYKTQTSDGRLQVQLSLANTSGGNFAIEEKAMEGISEGKLSPTMMYNIYVSLMDDQGNIISQPYEYYIKSLGANDKKTILFYLLKDMDAVTVSVNYGDKITEKKIYLKRKGTSNSIAITPDFYAQEVQTGATANYKFAVEYYGEGKQNLLPAVENLPAGFTWSVISESNSITVSDIMFTPASAQQRFVLQISIPEKSEDNFELDKPLPFKFLLKNKEGELAGFTDLQLTPSGKAELITTIDNLYIKVEKGKEILIDPVFLENNGLRTLTNISHSLLLPPGWDYKIYPEKIIQIDPKQKIKLRIVVIPGKATASGIYEIKYKAQGKNVDKIVSAQEQQIKVEMTEEINIFLVIVLILVSLGIVGGVIYGMIKISKN